jgi:hypothetical protein
MPLPVHGPACNSSGHLIGWHTFNSLPFSGKTATVVGEATPVLPRDLEWAGFVLNSRMLWKEADSKPDWVKDLDAVGENFEERWLKASKRSAAKKLSKLSRSHNESLLWIKKIPDIIAIDDEIYSNDDDPERWDMQVSLPKGSINHCKINNSDIHGRSLRKFHLESRFSDQLIRILSRVFQKIHGRPLVR